MLIFVLLPLAPAAANPPMTRDFWSQTAPGRAGGVLHAKVVTVDYGRGLLVVRVGGGTQTIRILPTTTIMTKHNSNGALVDLRPGTLVEIILSDVGGESVAQLVRIH